MGATVDWAPFWWTVAWLAAGFGLLGGGAWWFWHALRAGQAQLGALLCEYREREAQVARWRQEMDARDWRF